MLFNSFSYLIFLLIVVIVYYTLHLKARMYFLWLSSMFFAFCWGWQSGILLLFQTTMAYVAGRYIARTSSIKAKKRGVAISAIILLGVLGFYKYSNFFLDSVAVILQVFDISCSIKQISLLLPIGISFYTFICLGYVIDVYRGKCPAETNWMKFCLFSTFFPQLASGPISRASELLPQQNTLQRCDPKNLTIGFRLILWGLFKKIVIADRLAQFTNPVFNAPENYTGLTLLVAMYFFAIQIYCDFSGYSDIAIGSAKMLGLNLRQNFKLPYFADSIYDFWKRWHISLTAWLRDYLYISLGGNRVGKVRWQINIILVFLVSGLWHGAAWTFIVWGGIHGIIYLFEFGWKKLMERFQFEFPENPGVRLLKIFITFNIVCVTWVFFRSVTFDSAITFLSRIFTAWGNFQWGVSKIPTMFCFGLIAFGLITEICMYKEWFGDYLTIGRCPAILRILGYSILLMGIALLAVQSDSFIYLQF